MLGDTHPLLDYLPIECHTPIVSYLLICCHQFMLSELELHVQVLGQTRPFGGAC